MSGTFTSIVPPPAAGWAAGAGAGACTAGAGATAAGAGAAWGAGAAAAPCSSSSSTSEPSETASPTLIFSALTMPLLGDGTSMVALSDSSVTSESSALTVSPALTCTSMTGTSL